MRSPSTQAVCSFITSRDEPSSSIPAGQQGDVHKFRFERIRVLERVVMQNRIGRQIAVRP
jgi:hypothetical protein